MSRRLARRFWKAELFGYEKGAFTGADKVRKGLIEHANGGTLFLDEIGDMPLNLQAKLLRVLQERQIVRVGSNDGSRPIQVDFRLLSPCAAIWKWRVHQETFRDDLYYRLKGVRVSCRPCANDSRTCRSSSTTFCLKSRTASVGRARPSTCEVLDRLRAYPWPGNVRELLGVILRRVHRVPRHARLARASGPTGGWCRSVGGDCRIGGDRRIAHRHRLGLDVQSRETVAILVGTAGARTLEVCAGQARRQSNQSRRATRPRRGTVGKRMEKHGLV